MIELVSYEPRIELFARKHIDGWSTIGYDIDGLGIIDSIDRVAAL